MTTKKKSTYTPRPEVDPTVQPEVLVRLEVVSRVMSGQTTVTDAAMELGISRNRFQTIYHRSLGAMMGELEAKPAGRPPKDSRVADLEERNREMADVIRQLMSQLEASRRATAGLAEIVREHHSIGNRRSARTKSAVKTETTSEADDDDDVERALLREARRLIDAGMSEELAAATVKTAASTLRRWRVRERASEPLTRRRGPHASASTSTAATNEAIAAAKQRVCDVRGHIGSASLGKAVGLSRRVAADVKAQTITEMERTRKANARRVEVTVPGVMRGFDQMYVATSGGWRFALLSADASVPYRTSAHVSERYLSDDVCAALEHDYQQNGAPLVERLDRAAVHRTPQVRELLRGYGVLALHGPPRHPRYYGQLERQNREHRAWLDDVEIRDQRHLADELSEMTRCLNELVPRRSLGWCTPAQRWKQRPDLQIDRVAFGDEVRERAARISTKLTEEELALGYDQRFAIEQALTAHGLLRVTNEGRC